MSKKGLEVKRTWGGKEKLTSLIKKEKDVRIKDRLQAILYRLLGIEYTEIAKRLNRTIDTPREWVKRWNKSGYDGLKDAPRSGRPRILNNYEEKCVLDFVKNSNSGTRNTCKTLAFKIKKEFNKELSDATVRNLLINNRLSWKKPDKVDYRQNEEERKKVMEDLKKIERNTKGIRVLVLG